MENRHKLILIASISSSFVLFVLSALICVCRRKGSTKDESLDREVSFGCKENGAEEMDIKGDLIRFEGGEGLTCVDILDAPGEVIGKSGYGTLYRANLVRNDSVVVLRFLRPSCTEKVQDVMHVVRLLGSIRHPNLVPLCGFYSGFRGEKLLVHPHYSKGNLAQFIRGDDECHKWSAVSRISTGIARGLEYLHTGLQKPIIHGNLKSKNILLGRNQQPFVSDFGLHALLNPPAAQRMLEQAAIEGYKAPELIKVKDANEATDIYNFGLILLELLTGKEAVDEKADPHQDFHLPTSLRSAILNHRMSDLYHPDILLDAKKEERILGFLQLAMACCSPLPSLRPDIKQIRRKLEEI